MPSFVRTNLNGLTPDSLVCISPSEAIFDQTSIQKVSCIGDDIVNNDAVHRGVSSTRSLGILLDKVLIGSQRNDLAPLMELSNVIFSGTDP